MRFFDHLVVVYFFWATLYTYYDLLLSLYVITYLLPFVT